jgi:hypothetical protein
VDGGWWGDQHLGPGVASQCDHCFQRPIVLDVRRPAIRYPADSSRVHLSGRRGRDAIECALGSPMRLGCIPQFIADTTRLWSGRLGRVGQGPDECGAGTIRAWGGIFSTQGGVSAPRHRSQIESRSRGTTMAPLQATAGYSAPAPHWGAQSPIPVCATRGTTTIQPRLQQSATPRATSDLPKPIHTYRRLLICAGASVRGSARSSCDGSLL